MKLSEKLQKIRKENNITQEGLADKLNVSRQAVSKWESGSAYPDTEKLIQISKIFNVSLDELINDNIDRNTNNSSQKISFMEIFNNVLEFISKSVNMFWSMKFIDKIKCLFEMIVLILIIIGVWFISTSIIINLIRRILAFIPSELLYGICNLFEGLLLLVWIVLGIIILVKIFKMRYLDYYVFITDNNVTEKTIEEPIKELKENKEYKVVIRDPKDSSLNVVKKMEKIFSILIKCFSFLLEIPLIIFLILCIIFLVYSIFYIFDGLFFNGISLAILGVILFIYLMIEFIYNLLFNRKHAVNRIFVLFIISVFLIGIGLGLSFVSLSNFTFIENEKMETNIHTIEMSDDLVLTSMIYDINDCDIIIDNSLDNIKLEVTSYGQNDVYVYSYNEYRTDGYKKNLFRVMEISTNYNGMEIYKDVINNLKEKKIVNYNVAYEVKIYVSETNLTKLRTNINNYTESIWLN